MGDSSVEQDDIAYYLTNIKVKKRYEDLLTNNFVDKPVEDGGECKKPQTTEKEALDAILGAIVAQEKQIKFLKNQGKIPAKNMHAKISITAEELAAKDTEYLKATQYYAQKTQQVLQNLQSAYTNQSNANNAQIHWNKEVAGTPAGPTGSIPWGGSSGTVGLNSVPALAFTPPKPAPESMEALYKGSCFDPESEKHLKFDGQVLLLGEEVEAKKSKTKAKSWAEAIAKVKKGIMGDLNMSNGYTAGMDVAEKEPIKATQYYTDYSPYKASMWSWKGSPCSEAAYKILNNGDIHKAANFCVKDGVIVTEEEYYG